MEFQVKTFSELTGAQVYELLKARSLVFMLEQEIRCLDMDGKDYESLHVFAEEKGEVIACLRAFPTGKEGEWKIGRVLTRSRGKGIGRALMAAAQEAIARQIGASCILVDAQKQAVPFYAKCGFLPEGEEFLEEGIVHLAMRKQL